MWPENVTELLVVGRWSCGEESRAETGTLNRSGGSGTKDTCHSSGGTLEEKLLGVLKDRLYVHFR